MFDAKQPFSPVLAAAGTTPDAGAALAREVVRTLGQALDDAVFDALDAFQKHLLAVAETSHGAQQLAAIDAMRQYRMHCGDVCPAYLPTLEKAFAQGIEAKGAGERIGVPSDAWRLLDNTIVEERALIDMLAARLDTRLHLPLHLLGHRFGALLRCAPMDAQHLPIGPRALLRAMRQAAACMELAPAALLLLLQHFDRCLGVLLGELYFAANTRLVHAGVLPQLAGYQAAVREKSASPDPSSKAASKSGDAGPAAHEHSSPGNKRPFANWLDLADATPGASAESDASIFDAMRHLLGGRRALLGHATPAVHASGATRQVVERSRIEHALATLQERAAPQPVPTSEPWFAPLRPRLMSHLQRSQPPGEIAALPDEHVDTADLLDMLFDHLLRDVPANAATRLLTRLQVPLLRIALDDKSFFTRKQHPARLLLDALADTALYWTDAADAPEASERLGAVIAQLCDGDARDLEAFGAAGDRLRDDLAQRKRKAAIVERRHVDAERGRERLELARIAARRAIADVLEHRQPPAFVYTLLTTTWTSVLALSALRDDDTGTFARQVAVARHLAGFQDDTTLDEGQLRATLEAGLHQTGCHQGDIDMIVAHAFAPGAARAGQGDVPFAAESPASPADNAGVREAQIEPRSRPPESAADSASASADAIADAPHPAALPATKLATTTSFATAPHDVPPTDTPLTDTAKRHLEHLRRLPFGTWFELRDADGTRRRCRMSWFSPVTGRCLFVSARGQRFADHTLAWLAQEMENDRANIVREADTSVVDSAWKAILGMLRAFAPKLQEPDAATV